ncbi:hypothetical protein, partial [Endozoicomonas atrinae]|uniref:hypothetical protein n=1 Tax=Endozoicomonas atrinae TaxID=1333660 RepID=UPI0015866FCC
ILSFNLTGYLIYQFFVDFNAHCYSPFWSINDKRLHNLNYIPSTELQYIERLEQHDSWLSALLKSHQDCSMPIQRKSVDRNEIPLFNANSVRFDQSEGFLSVLESLKELVTYSRNFSLEW